MAQAPITYGLLTNPNNGSPVAVMAITGGIAPGARIQPLSLQEAQTHLKNGVGLDTSDLPKGISLTSDMILSGNIPGSGMVDSYTNPTTGEVLTNVPQSVVDNLSKVPVAYGGAKPNVAGQLPLNNGQPIQPKTLGDMYGGSSSPASMPPSTNLTPGMTSDAVKQLQQWLIDQGYSIPAGATGYYGEQTKAAVTAWQQKNGVDNSTGPGYWGPRSIAAASGQSSGAGSGKSDPNQPLTDAEYEAGVTGNAVNAARIAKGNTSEALQYAASSGDLSGLVNEYGQPFSLQEQQDALAQGLKDNQAFYDAQQANDKANAENALAQKTADYQDYLLSSGENFAQDKTTLDQNAADTGMLFSTARNQKEQKLQKSYEQEQASKLGSYGRDIANTAQDYQYKYGNNAANGLSQYYNLGSNAYNPNVASGGVTAGGLSSVYNPNNYNYQGTQQTARLAAANQRAAAYLTNKGNKLLSTSYNNKL